MDDNTDIKTPVKQKALTWLKASLGSILGVIIGGIGGYLYYRNVGCATGSCMITSNPWLITAWGAVMGYLIGSTFKKKPKKI